MHSVLQSYSHIDQQVTQEACGLLIAPPARSEVIFLILKMYGKSEIFSSNVNAFSSRKPWSKIEKDENYQSTHK
jgi:hypothetical protein